MRDKQRLVIGISGASGAIYGIRLLEILSSINAIETHLIISKAAHITIAAETAYTIKQLYTLADVVHKEDNIAASIASGSFKTMGMIIAPCSVKSMAQISTGNCGNLLTRAADVVLKEQRKLLLLLRETPLHLGHLRNMTSLAEMGAVIAPTVPAFYHNPQTIDDIINQTIGRALDHFDIDPKLVKRWQGIRKLDLQDS